MLENGRTDRWTHVLQKDGQRENIIYSDIVTNLSIMIKIIKEKDSVQEP